MEYACHGNLKDYLLKCREALLERNVPIRVSSEEGTYSVHRHYQMYVFNNIIDKGFLVCSTCDDVYN